MGDSEKLMALKKAYAEIILNTAKEAAAKITVSEKKAQRFQCELLATKDEALHMLLRLKQMLDSKVKEAEMTSLNQNNKIQELEAQLGEAEDIVKDLRTELRELQDELERISKKQMQPSGARKSDVEVEAQLFAFEESRPSTPASEISSLLGAQSDSLARFEMNDSTLNDISYDGNRCFSEKFLHEDDQFVCNPDFSSMVMSGNEPELYRNGCTQRIRASERNVLDGNLSFSGQSNDAKNKIFIREDEGGKTIHKKSTAIDEVYSAEKNLDGIKVSHENGNCIHVHPFSSSRRKRKRASGYRKLTVSSFKSFPSRAIDCVAPSGEGSRASETKGQKNFVTLKSVSNASEKNMKSGTVEFNKTHLEFVDTCPVLNRTNNADKLLIDDVGLAGMAAGSEEGAEFSASKTDRKLTSVSLVNSDQKESSSGEALSTLPTENKFLKYTFQRKRKKGFTSSPDGKSSIDDINLKRMTVEKEIGFMDSQNSSLTTESRDSWRLAQVARQVGSFETYILV